MVLKKSQLLNGINDIELVELKCIKDDDNELALRPLSNGEWTRIEAIQNEAIGEYVTTEKAKNNSRRRNRVQSQMEAQAKINIKDTGEAEAKARNEAVYLSLQNDYYKDDEKFTREDVENMKRGVVLEIYEHVRTISGLDDDDLEKEVKDFPED